jgi:hypothetical protein
MNFGVWLMASVSIVCLLALPRIIRWDRERRALSASYREGFYDAAAALYAHPAAPGWLLDMLDGMADDIDSPAVAETFLDYVMTGGMRGMARTASEQAILFQRRIDDLPPQTRALAKAAISNFIMALGSSTKLSYTCRLLLRHGGIAGRGLCREFFFWVGQHPHAAAVLIDAKVFRLKLEGGDPDGGRRNATLASPVGMAA